MHGGALNENLTGGTSLNEYSYFENTDRLGNPDYFVQINRTTISTPVSPFHEIHTWHDEENKIANMVIEIPKGTNYKLEIIKEKKCNPIMHDIKDGKVRTVNWKGGYPAHYGAISQTWEDPEHIDRHTGKKGDNDPLDAFNIAGTAGWTGKVVPVKILGIYAMIDGDETDWKVICISTEDPLSKEMNNLADVERLLPGKLNELYVFLRDYKKKTPDDKENENKFAFNGKPKDKDFAIDIIKETHEAWEDLIERPEAHPKAAKFWFPKSRTCQEDKCTIL